MTYDDAYRDARTKAKLTGMPYGIERNKYATPGGFTTFMLPKDPNKRFGHELRCEVVEPDAPLIQRADGTLVG